MEFNRTDLVFWTKLDYFSYCCQASSVAVLQLKFSSWPKIHTAVNSLSCSARLRLVCSEAATILSPLCDTVLMFLQCGGYHIQCATPFIFGEELLFCMQTTHSQRCTNSCWHTHVYLSSSCLQRPPPGPIPSGLVLNKKRFLVNSISNSAWAMVFMFEKQMLSIWKSMFLCFLSASTKQ